MQQIMITFKNSKALKNFCQYRQPQNSYAFTSIRLLCDYHLNPHGIQNDFIHIATTYYNADTYIIPDNDDY